MKGLFAVTGHRLGAVAVQELEHVLMVNAARWARGEEPYYVLAMGDTLAAALEAEKKLRKAGREKPKEEPKERPPAEEHGAALVAIGAALAAARSNLKEAEGYAAPKEEVERWKRQVEALEGSVRKLWG